MRKSFLVFIICVLMFPMYWLLTGSLRDSPGMFSIPPKLIPTSITLVNYAKAIQADGLLRWLLNTAIITIIVVAGSVFVSFTGGWFLAMNRGMLANLIVGGLLLSIMVPRQTLLIPLFVEMRRMGLVNHLLGASLPIWYSPVSVLFARNWIKSAPKIYWEDAQLMGAGGWTLFRYVIIPLSAPVLGFVFLMQGIAALSDYLWQSLVLQTNDKLTAYVGLMGQIQMASFERWPNIQGWRLAISVLMLVPLLIVGLLSQRQFKDNIARGIAE
jgi:ABC-type glycerol-3-phosphate transport system permease component